MIADYEEIRRLYMERLAGLFTEAEEREYLDLLEGDNEARRIVALLEEENKNNGTEDFIAGIAEETELLELKERLAQTRKKKSKMFNRVWSAAAALIMVTGLAVWFAKIESPETIARTEITATQNNGIQLKLSDGKSVRLSDDMSSKTIMVGDLKMVTDKGGLQSVSGNGSDGMNTLVVPKAEEYHIVLDDGTKVWLNSASELHFPFRFSGKNREVTIQGEAYFEVARNTERPFIVNAGNTRIQVLGTHFNVNAYEGIPVKTSLVEGRVQLNAEGAKAIQLTKGQEATYLSGKGFIAHDFDPENTLSWMRGTYYFHDQRLTEIASVISNWFDVRVAFEHPELKNYELTGLLEKGQLRNFMKDLETSAQISCRLEGKVLYLNKKID